MAFLSKLSRYHHTGLLLLRLGAGGLLFLTGFFFRPACGLMLITMVVAAMHHFGSGEGLKGASHAIELGIVFVAMLIIGPGKFSIDKS